MNWQENVTSLRRHINKSSSMLNSYCFTRRKKGLWINFKVFIFPALVLMDKNSCQISESFKFKVCMLSKTTVEWTKAKSHDNSVAVLQDCFVRLSLSTVKFRISTARFTYLLHWIQPDSKLWKKNNIYNGFI